MWSQPQTVRETTASTMVADPVVVGLGDKVTCQSGSGGDADVMRLLS